jgi:hypothetical protein
MKLNNTLLFYVSYVLSAPQDEAQLPGCITKMDCKLKENFEKFKTNPNALKCKDLTKDEDIFKCAYKLMGYKENQAEVLFKLVPAFEKCNESTKPQLTGCLSKCSNNQSCKENCALKGDETASDCFAKQYDIKDFDAKKAAKCSSECDKDTVAEIIDCDMKCKEPIYKKFENGTKDSKSDSQTDSKNSTTTTKSESKDSKPTSSANSSSTKPSSGISNLSIGLFSVISIPALLSLIL